MAVALFRRTILTCPTTRVGRDVYAAPAGKYTNRLPPINIGTLISAYPTEVPARTGVGWLQPNWRCWAAAAES